MPPVKRISFVEGPPLDCGQLTVAIGPNNGGKSRFLRELVQSLTGVEAPRLAVAGLDLDREIVDAQAEQLIGAPASLDESGNLVFDVMTPDLGSANQVRPQPGYIQTIRSEPRLLGQLLQQIGAHLVAHLTTDRRLFLVNKHVNRNDLRGAQSPLHAAYLASGQVIDRINSLVEQAFGERLVLDKSDFAVAEFRLSPAGTRPDGSDHEQMAALPRLDEQGDGIRAFCGLIVATALVSRPIVLIDEPEAFLHPPQAFVAGRSLGILSQAEHQLFVATHSAEVLRGLLSENRAVNIMRFSRGGGGHGYSRHSINHAELKIVADDPVLSSARVLDGLFYQGVIIVESDGDAVVYRRVLEQLGFDGVFHFVNSYSKAASLKIAAPYRAMMVPHAAIVDFDILRVRDEARALASQAGLDWSTVSEPYELMIKEIEDQDTPEERLRVIAQSLLDLAKELSNDGDARTKLEAGRRTLRSIRESASVWSDLKKRGRAELNETAQSAFDDIDNKFRAHGIFIVPVGEREAWLPSEAPHSANKKHWTEQALEALANPLSSDHPLSKFLQDVADYLNRAT